MKHEIKNIDAESRIENLAPPKLKSKTTTFLIVAAVLGLLLIAACFSLVFYISSPDDFPVNRVIAIEQGSLFKKIARDFEEKKLIRSAFVFETLAWIYRKDREIKAGEYFFEKKLNAAELLKSIAGGSAKNKLFKITVPEGYNLYDIARLFENAGLWNREEFFKLTGQPAVDCRISVCVNRQSEFVEFNKSLALKPDYISMEGYLFPDTYFVPANIAPDTMIKIFLDNFERKINPEMIEAAEKNGHSIFEIITMASIIEKEAATEQDKKLVSGILWKRLEAGMLLQVDAVFPYVLGKNGLELTTEDLKTDSPYNTYRHKGLPLGPIANPGIETIKAALYPAESPFWYYLSDKEGKIYYSVSYDEHLLKKEKYLK